ncbi:MAG: Mur ligase family protein, partial [Bacteroidales bacterium]|nr:Mur ligase family protein [Bacteroidales bacterium]
MNYDETLHYLYNALPVFHKIGGAAYKEGLDNTLALDERFNHPHRKYQTIHIAGTNGKGSISHTLAAIFQLAGYKTGLYTSPHLVDFRERIRVNGEMIDKEYVVEYMARNKAYFEELQPSFFELTMMMAFCYFESQKVDIALIEVGLGGRLDSTNVITPELAIISNISFDHTQFLGDTLEK